MFRYNTAPDYESERLRICRLQHEAHLSGERDERYRLSQILDTEDRVVLGGVPKHAVMLVMPRHDVSWRAVEEYNRPGFVCPVEFEAVQVAMDKPASVCWFEWRLRR